LLATTGALRYARHALYDDLYFGCRGWDDFPEDYRGRQGADPWWSREDGPLDCTFVIDAAGGMTSQEIVRVGRRRAFGDHERMVHSTVSIYDWPYNY
jgi:hypothetical protein